MIPSFTAWGTPSAPALSPGAPDAERQASPGAEAFGQLVEDVSDAADDPETPVDPNAALVSSPMPAPQSPADGAPAELTPDPAELDAAGPVEAGMPGTVHDGSNPPTPSAAAPVSASPTKSPLDAAAPDFTERAAPKPMADVAPDTYAPSTTAVQPQSVPPLPGVAMDGVILIQTSVRTPQHPWAGSTETALLMRAADHATRVTAGQDEIPLPAPIVLTDTDTDTASPKDSPLPGFQPETPRPSVGQPAMPAPQTPSPHLPAATVPAMVHTIRTADSDSVDLVLNPEELGRLRFEITRSGDQVRITLSVERPETLDMLRRHAESLLTEFRQAGYSGATLSFGSWGQGGQQTAPGPQSMLPEPTAQDAPAPAKPAVTPTISPSASGLDLRL